MGFLQGFLAGDSGRSVKEHLDLNAFLNRASAQQKMREKQAQDMLNRALGILPSAQAGDSRAHMELASMGLMSRMLSPEEQRAQEQVRADRMRQEEYQRLDKEAAEKRWQTEMGLRKEESKIRLEETKAAREESKRRYEETKLRMERGEQREIEREETRKEERANKEFDEWEANVKAWSPVLKALYPEMSDSERLQLVDAYAKQGGPSVSERMMPAKLREEEEERQKKEAAMDAIIREQMPPPELPEIKVPEPPKPATPDDIKKRLARERRAREGMVEEAKRQAQDAPLSPRFDPMGIFAAREVAGRVTAVPEYIPEMEPGEADIARMVEEEDAARAAQYEEAMAAAERAQNEAYASLEKYEADIARRKQILREVPGQLGALLAGVTKTESPEQKGQAEFRKQQEKERLEAVSLASQLRAQLRTASGSRQREINERLDAFRARGWID